MKPAVEFKDYRWQYEGGRKDALRIPELVIGERSTVGVVGPNEQGKTTLVRTLNGIIPHSHRGVLKGEARVLGENVAEVSHQDLSRKVGVVFSDPDSQFTSMSVEEELVFGLENLNLPLAEIRGRLEWITRILELEDFLAKPPYELSGGQKQKVAIASVVVMKPKILVLDEPTSMLDPRGKEEIFRAVRRIKEEERITLVITEHNLEELLKIVDRVIHLDEGTLVFEGAVADFINAFDYSQDKIYPPEISSIFDFLKRGKEWDGDIPWKLEEGLKRYQRP